MFIEKHFFHGKKLTTNCDKLSIPYKVSQVSLASHKFTYKEKYATY